MTYYIEPPGWNPYPDQGPAPVQVNTAADLMQILRRRFALDPQQALRMMNLEKLIRPVTNIDSLLLTPFIETVYNQDPGGTGGFYTSGPAQGQRWHVRAIQVACNAGSTCDKIGIYDGATAFYTDSQTAAANFYKTYSADIILENPWTMLFTLAAHAAGVTSVYLYGLAEQI